LAWYDDPVTVVAVALVIVVAVGTLIYLMRRQDRKGPQPPKPQKQSSQTPKTDLDLPYSPNIPFRVSKSIQAPIASNAKDELRTLDLEREILGDAIRKLYEAHAEGKISESERDKLASTYKLRMDTIKTAITKDESIIALHELESMQEDLMKLFSERFGELSTKVEALRGTIEVKPIREIPIKIPKFQTTEKPETTQDIEETEEETEEDKTKQPKKRKPPEEKPTPKTEAERRIESIRSEVEKVLDKLGQMEIES
jgi:hypothetical protein